MRLLFRIVEVIDIWTIKLLTCEKTCLPSMENNR